MRRAWIIALGLLVGGLGAGEEPWEPGPSRGIPPLVQTQEPDVLDHLMDFYQREISDKTISRCPFHTSCSYFALESLRRHGAFMGTLRALDRLFYREHPQARFYYPLVKAPGGKRKINDDYFLEN